MICSYLLAETDERASAVCLYQAINLEAIRAHARAADIPVDDVVKVDAIDVWRPDLDPAAPSPAQAHVPLGSASNAPTSPPRRSPVLRSTVWRRTLLRDDAGRT